MNTDEEIREIIGILHIAPPPRSLVSLLFPRRQVKAMFKKTITPIFPVKQDETILPLYVGGMNARYHVAAYNVTVVISVSTPSEREIHPPPQLPAGVCEIVIDMPNMAPPVPAFLDVVRDVYEAILLARVNGQRVLVHCDTGRSRAPALIVAYLIGIYASLDRALAEVRYAMPDVQLGKFLLPLAVWEADIIASREASGWTPSGPVVV